MKEQSKDSESSETPDNPVDQDPGPAQPDEEQQAQLREVSEEELKQILEAHQKWLESEGKEGKQASLGGANLQKAHLRDSPLGFKTKGLTASQVKAAENWELAYYSKDFLKELGLPPDHNERVKEKLAEMEKE